MQILLMRHAKSSWKDASLSDHDRPVKKRGRQDVPRMAGILRENGLVPQTVITSSAVRAQQTAEILAAELAITDLKVEPLLYHCEPGVWFDFLTRWEGTGLSLWVGHNPGLEDFLSQFAGQTMHFPTSAMALLERTPSGTGTPFKIVQTWTPKGI